ncbi:MAG: hypothetical protein ABJG41_12590 [Cyclobacteriaceae bacterium]
MTLLIGCLDPPEYSNTPKIKFKRLEFVSGDGRADSLKLTFDFEDGDGNIGLSELDVWDEFFPYYFIVYYDSGRLTTDTNGDTITAAGYYIVTLSDSLAVPPFKLGTTNGELIDEVFSEVDNRPAFDPRCDDYLYGDGWSDTLFVTRNPYYNNMDITFLKKRNGQFIETDLAQEFNQDECDVVPEVLRIPIFDPERIGKPTVGNITYSYLSNGVGLFLAQLDTFKIEFFIYDRDLNKSNVVQTPEYTLSDID